MPANRDSGAGAKAETGDALCAHEIFLMKYASTCLLPRRAQRHPQRQQVVFTDVQPVIELLCGGPACGLEGAQIVIAGETRPAYTATARRRGAGNKREDGVQT